MDMLPEGFAAVDLPGVRLDIRYAGSHNFMGCAAEGYLAPRAILTCEAEQALRSAARGFVQQGLGLLIYDAYRPQRAVDHFARWAKDAQDTRCQAEFYPDLPKESLFARGYIALRSGHSRGSAVDLTLTNAQGEPLDMGGAFDWFSPVSAHDYKALTAAQRANRALLREGMACAGFDAYSAEWWHYTLHAEPYPQTYFDFDVR